MITENPPKGMLHQLAAISTTSTESTVRYLLSTGQCHVNDRDFEGATPLHIAASVDNYEICKLLLSFGADPLLTDDKGRTAYNLAVGRTRRYFRKYLKCDKKSQRTKFSTLTRLFRTLFACTSGVQNSSVNITKKSNQWYYEPHCIKKDDYHSPVRSTVPPSLSKASSSSPTDSFVTARGSITLSNCSKKSIRLPPVLRKPTLPRIEDEAVASAPTYTVTSIPSCFSQHLTDDSGSSTDSDEVALSEVTAYIMKMSDQQLRRELTIRGVDVGPLLPSTRGVYEKKLARLMSINSPRDSIMKKRYSMALEEAVAGNDFYELGKKLDNELINGFLAMSRRSCREGKRATSFCYILIDPLVIGDPATCNLEEFLQAVFYVGKGKRSRPLEHLLEAVRYKQQRRDGTIAKTAAPESAKLSVINDIWSRGYGVVSLHVFQNTIPVEAFTREAAMIDAVGLKNLTNCRRGDYYGISKGWTYRQKTVYGSFLLMNAMHILHIEGCRQLFEQDVVAV